MVDKPSFELLHAIMQHAEHIAMVVNFAVARCVDIYTGPNRTFEIISAEAQCSEDQA